ncbi:MAG: SRPBCC domain-containing protein [Planctomyces sp.]|nr:SRPBCC domain-containing protein [Planctomyces sp.]
MTELVQQVAKVIIKAPIQKVWDALTQEGVVLEHFFGSVMHTSGGIKPGSQLRMRTPNGKYTGVVGEILECDPPHRFSHTFRFTNFEDQPCRVTYELKEVDGGVEFTLISDRIPQGTKTEKQMAQGGPFICDVLKSVVETGRPSFGKRMILGIIRLTSPMSPAACRSEHWPMDRKV